jgi:hypothetical protein
VLDECAVDRPWTMFGDNSLHEVIRRWDHSDVLAAEPERL